MATVHEPSKAYALNVRFVGADIAYVSACAVVTSEGPDFQFESVVTRSLQDAFPEIRKYRRLKIPPKYGMYRFGEVLTSYLGPSFSNDASRPRGFTYLFHAVMSGQCGSRDTWLRDMQILYCNLFSKAEELKIFSLALPILGSGVADKDLAIKALVSSIMSCRPFYLTELMIVCQNRELLNTAMGSLTYEYYCGRGRCHLTLQFMNDSQTNASLNLQNYGKRKRQDQSHSSECKGNQPPLQTRDKKKRHQYMQSSPTGISDEDMKEAMACSLGDMPVQISSSSNAVMNLNLGDDLVNDGGESAYSHSDKDASSVNNDKDLSSICSICLTSNSVPKRMGKCGHIFCKDCIDRSFRECKPVCPSCNMVDGIITGNQPDGQMIVGYSGDHLPGYEGHGTISITYNFPSGTQAYGHPNPGQPFKGTTRRAYLPDNTEGREVLKLLRTAFDRKLIFTIGQSITTGQDSVVTCKDIHHKTNMTGGPTSCGYPDQNYLSRVRDQLCSKGVMEPKQGTTEETPIRKASSEKVMMKQTNSSDYACSHELTSDDPFNPTHSKTPEENIKTEFLDTRVLRKVARRKGLRILNVEASVDSIFISLSQQVSHVLKDEIGSDELRKMLTVHLKEADHLNQFLVGTTLDQYLDNMAENGDQDHLMVSAAANVLKVEIVLIGPSGYELPFQPFEGKTYFLPKLFLGFIPPRHYVGLEQLKDYESDIPTHWSRMSNETELVMLQTGNTEYKEVKQKFLASIGSSKKKRTVKEIRRVQSVTQWKSYDLKRQQLSKQYPEQAIERQLWHGTSGTSIKPICKDGFNRSYSGKNATIFGKGVYFSEMADYAAHDTYSVPDTDGCKYMFLARVLTGMYTQGERGMRVPPWLDEQEHVKFDSVVDNMDKPIMFVIFHDQQAYPEYLITFM